MKNNNLALLNEAKYVGQDFEWYPTTQAIINEFYEHVRQFRIESLLDVGAGNGKVLMQFAELKSRTLEAARNNKDANSHRAYDNYNTELFAIEKSRPLLDTLHSDIGIMGTDFWEQTLLDKSVDCMFSNPPYSEFVNWTEKLIREANANFIYLVLPQRWKEQRLIQDALKARKAEFKIIGEFDFLVSEDRAARAKVDLIFICLCHQRDVNSPSQRNRFSSPVDPFDLWIEENFKFKSKSQSELNAKMESEAHAFRNRSEEIKHELVGGDGLIEVLDRLYKRDLNRLLENYKKISDLDSVIFNELDIKIGTLMENIKSRVKGLKSVYWNELFDRYEVLTKRLTSKSRDAFLRLIRTKTNIDFTSGNAYAISAWAIRNANSYFDKQMIDVFEEMISLANIQNYKSNQRVFQRNEYRYGKLEADHIKLDYRVVLERSGGLSTSRWDSDKTSGLEKRAADFLNDLLVVADNLGFARLDSISQHHFHGSSKHVFVCKERNTVGLSAELFDVRAFKNGNMHIRFAKPFIFAMNIEVGRLKGWIHNVQHGATELQEDVNEVSKFFKQTYTLLPNSLDRLLLGNSN